MSNPEDDNLEAHLRDEGMLTMDEQQALRRLVRLGGEYERASQGRDYLMMTWLDKQTKELGSQLSEDYAWWLLVIRGRNVIRRARGIEEIHY